MKLKVSYLENIEKVEMIRFLENNYKILSVKLNEVNASVIGSYSRGKIIS